MKKIFNKKSLTIIIIFFIFFITYRIVPMMYDGWAGKYYYYNSNGIIRYIYYILTGFYNFINGRITSNIVSGILESFNSEIPLDLFNSLTIVGIIILILKINKITNTKKYISSSILYCVLMLLVSSNIRKEVLFYAHTSYMMPILLFLLYFYLYQKYINIENNKIENRLLLFMSIIGFSICTWMEHIAVGFGITIVLIWIYSFIKKKNFKIKLIYPILSSAVGGLIMFLSPGLRISREIVSNNSMYTIIVNNVMFFKKEIFLFNVIIFSFLFLVIGLFIVEKKKNKILAAMNFTIAIILFITASINYLNVNFMQNIITFIFDNNLIFILGIIFTLYSLEYSFQSSKKSIFNNYILLITLFALIPICFTPNNGARVASIGIFAIIIIIVSLFSEISINHKFKFANYIIIIFFIISLDKNILLCRRIYETTKIRNRAIQNVIELQEIGNWDYNNILILPEYNEDDILLKGATEIGTFHYPQFLESSGLNKNTRVIFSNEKKGIYLEQEKNELTVKLYNYVNLKQKYKYILSVYNNNETNDIENSGWIYENMYIFNNLEKGKKYNIKVYYDENTNEFLEKDYVNE